MSSCCFEIDLRGDIRCSYMQLHKRINIKTTITSISILLMQGIGDKYMVVVLLNSVLLNCYKEMCPLNYITTTPFSI